MKRIPLTQGKFALVDDVDYERLNKYKWYAVKNKNTFYAVRCIHLPGRKSRVIWMHREILGLKRGDPRQTDHRNHNGLANWRDNLRICNGLQNSRNKSKQKNCSSKYKGVSWYKAGYKWKAEIRVDNHSIYLGYFDNEIEAARVYDNAARKHFKEFANTNF